MIVDLVRHGTTGRTGCLDGRTDPRLTDEGRRQFTRATSMLRPAIVITSPRQRAHEPAVALAARTGARLASSADWAELDLGAWDGRTRDAIAADVGEHRIDAFYRNPEHNMPPEAEDWPAFVARVERGLRALIPGPAGHPTLVVTHAGPMRLAMSLACGMPLERLWAVRIGYATRVRLELGIDSARQLWGEILEIAQPPLAPSCAGDVGR